MGVDCFTGLGKSVRYGGLESEHETVEAYGTHILRWSPKMFLRVESDCIVFQYFL